MKKRYKIRKNHNTHKYGVYEIHNGKFLWVKDCNASNEKDAKKEFEEFAQYCFDEYLRLGGNPDEFPETEVIL